MSVVSSSLSLLKWLAHIHVFWFSRVIILTYHTSNTKISSWMSVTDLLHNMALIINSSILITCTYTLTFQSAHSTPVPKLQVWHWWHWIGPALPYQHRSSLTGSSASQCLSWDVSPSTILVGSMGHSCLVEKLTTCAMRNDVARTAIVVRYVLHSLLISVQITLYL